jgi:hypothetical protein
MAPAAVEADIPVHSKSQSREPLKLSGALKDVEHFDVTPAIGREFPKANLVEWLEAPNSDELIRDLAITSELFLSESYESLSDLLQSLNAASSSSELRITSQMIFRRSLSSVLES